jgi:uncharacterized protein YaeQ
MADGGRRRQFRIHLSDVERGRDRDETLVVGQHPSETDEHVALCVLAWCLVDDPGLAFGPGLSQRDTPDLWSHTGEGRVRTWVECGLLDGERLRRILRRNPDAAVHVFVTQPRDLEELDRARAGVGRGGERVTVWLIAAPLVAALGAEAAAREKWEVTVSGEHLYLTVDGRAYEGPFSST